MPTGCRFNRNSACRCRCPEGGRRIVSRSDREKHLPFSGGVFLTGHSLKRIDRKMRISILVKQICVLYDGCNFLPFRAVRDRPRAFGGFAAVPTDAVPPDPERPAAKAVDSGRTAGMGGKQTRSMSKRHPGEHPATGRTGGRMRRAGPMAPSFIAGAEGRRDTEGHGQPPINEASLRVFFRIV
jgi:hypothetical protein